MRHHSWPRVDESVPHCIGVEGTLKLWMRECVTAGETDHDSPTEEEQGGDYQAEQ